MILDENLEFASALDVSSTAGTSLEGDVADLDSIGRRLFSNNNLSLVIQVTTAFVGSGATVQFVLATDAAAAIAADGSETRHITTQDYSMANLALGATIVVPLPGSFPTWERYLGVEVITAGATTTAGSINAFLTMNADDWVAGADATN